MDSKRWKWLCFLCNVIAKGVNSSNGPKRRNWDKYTDGCFHCHVIKKGDIGCEGSKRTNCVDVCIAT
jgi:hypothetical protein